MNNVKKDCRSCKEVHPLFRCCALHSLQDKNFNIKIITVALYPLPDRRLVADMGSHQSSSPLHRSSNHGGWDWSGGANRIDLHEVGGTAQTHTQTSCPSPQRKTRDLILQRNLNPKTTRNPGHSNACGCQHRYMDGVSTLEDILLITNA